MKRLLVVVSTLLLAACAAAPDPVLEPGPAPPRADLWFSTIGPGLVRSLNLHETDAGWRGSVWMGSGNGFAIRNIVYTEDQLAFQVPGFVATFTAMRDG